MASDQELVAAALPLYEVQSELGRGAWGVVLAGKHRQLGRDVAIKMLPHAFGADPAVRSRFYAEARVLASFEHPHIVPIYDFVEHDGLCVLVMERLTGGTVWSRGAGGVAPEAASALILAACAGLQYAHQRGVLHRDIKPENLLFSGTGVLKVADFGIAKVVGGAATVATRAGEVLGTPTYMAPEQAHGGELTPATDIYAMGSVLYQLLSGQLPFPTDSNPVAMLYRHVHEAPRPLGEVAPQVPRALAEVTARTLEKDPADRYASAEELAIAVATAAAGAWGTGWLAATQTTVTATAPVLSAAIGQHAQPAGETMAPGAVAALAASADSPQAPPADLVPVSQLEPKLAATGPRTAPAPPPGATMDFGTAAAQGSVPGGAAAAPPPPPGRRSRRRLVLIALGIAGLAIGGFLALTSGKDDAPTRIASTAGQILLPGEWSAVKEAPTARQQLSAIATDSAIWVLGGYTDQQSTAKVERYEPGPNRWEAEADLPLPLHHEVGVNYKGDLVVAGGWLPVGDNLTGTTSDKVFALRGGKWRELPPLRHARAAAAAAVAGDKIVVFGGQAGGQLVPQTEIFDGTKWVDAPDLPTPRDHLGGASDGKFVYAVGGRTLSADKNLDTFERFDVAAQTWEALPPLPTPRGDLGAAIIGGRLVAVGGETPTAALATVEAFDFAAAAWAPAPAMPTPRHGAGVAALGSFVYAIDGALRPGHSASTATTERLSFTAKPGVAAGGEWQKIRDAPTPRVHPAATVNDGTVWLLGGIIDGAPSAKVEGYDPTIDTWKTGPDLPLPVHSAMAATYNGEIVLLGGWVRTGPRGRESVSNQVFALRQGGWVELPPLKDGRAAGGATVVGNRLIVVSGEGNAGPVATTEVFENNRWVFGADLPAPRNHFGIATDGHYVFTMGGRVGGEGARVATFERYDPDARRWDPLPAMPTARAGLGAAFVKGKIVAVGGEVPGAVLVNTETFDLRANAWAPAAPLKVPRWGAGVAATRSSVFVLTGHVPDPSTAAEVLRF